MIRHSVVFKLKYPNYSEEEKIFLQEAMKLSSIPGVEYFECLKQSGKKNKFDFALFMEFSNYKHYEDYTSHKDHIYFVEKYWMNEVEDFIELDYEPLEQ
jgi:hypothetical protein